jgi:lactoylglutathione lyase
MKDEEIHIIQHLSSNIPNFPCCLVSLLLTRIMIMQTELKEQHPVINHIAVYVTDIKNSAQFYRQVLQLTGIPDPFKNGKYAWFQIGSHCQLHLIEGAKEKVKQHINNHLAFTVASVEDFVVNLSAQGIVYRDADGKPGIIQIRPDGIHQVFFQDPDGYWLEVNNDVNSFE